ncbi:MAG TPA: Gfo/Idh/MocA family oxidoreductase [Acidobacteriaceae bacterium]|nr:Gfo/Idh/MocA family oxidoreductase [Acidobacteriaceae bacterium]
MISRRTFLRTSAAAASATALSSRFTARSYAQIAGANERVNFAVIGLNSRAYAHLSSLKANEAKARLVQVCDVDTIILARYAAASERALQTKPQGEQDFRHVLASKDVDVVTIATPDHWHAPMAILALEAGKHVYVEKPCSHNPREGKMLVEAQRKYGKLCQMGSQQRSSPHSIEIVEKIHGGLIGRAYWAETWYTNRRKPIGVGKPVAVPATLDWDLWQGPAPRREYKDNIHPYNWHWFTNWGTGEALNNGTHEVDVARWALGAEFPTEITAAGGRYAAHDDWQFYDTLDTSFVYPDQLITWKGDCCSGKTTYGRERGTCVHGTNGSVIIDRDGYEVYDLKDKLVNSFRVPNKPATSSTDLVGADSMTDAHFANMIAAIRTGEPLRQPVAQGNVAVTMLQLSNIAYFTGRSLKTDPQTFAILNDKEAEAMTGRTYEKGWAPKV